MPTLSIYLRAEVYHRIVNYANTAEVSVNRAINEIIATYFKDRDQEKGAPCARERTGSRTSRT